jgi:mitochondrial fission protein ELM1
MSDLIAPRLCWVVSDGRRGIENQALGLAEAVGRLMPLTIERRIAPCAEGLRDRASSYLRAPRIEDLTPPPGETAGSNLPDLWIGCGRASLPYSERARAWLGGRGFVVQVQDPRRPLHPFDLVIPPLHDRLEGPNVFSILGSPNRVGAAKLAAGAAAFAASPKAPPAPRAAFLIGGDSKRHRLTARTLEAIQGAMRRAQEKGFGLLITISRRTPPAAAETLRAAWADKPGVWFWGSDADGPNPYDAFLACADVVLATEDSTNMITEAATAGKPVILLPMDGDDGKFAALYEALARRGNARVYDGRIQAWEVEPLRETERAAAELARRFQARPSVRSAPA